MVMCLPDEVWPLFTSVIEKLIYIFSLLIFRFLNWTFK